VVVVGTNTVTFQTFIKPQILYIKNASTISTMFMQTLIQLYLVTEDRLNVYVIPWYINLYLYFLIFAVVSALIQH